METDEVIGVVPHAAGMTGAADRRRLGCWSLARQRQLEIGSPEACRVVVLPPLVDHAAWLAWRRRKDRRLVLNVVDFRYLQEALDSRRGLGQVARDAGRTLLYGQGRSRFLPPPYSRRLGKMLQAADIVVTSNAEHASFLAKFGIESRSILDCHEEIPMLKVRQDADLRSLRLLWEGKLATLPFLSELKPALTELARSMPIEVTLCTDLYDYRWANRFGKITPTELLRDMTGVPGLTIRVIPWSPSSLAAAAQCSHAAVLPVSAEDETAWMKAENRAMVMWRLGLPVLMSATPAYRRVAAESATDGVVLQAGQWLPHLQLLLDDTWRRQQALAGQRYVTVKHSPEMLHAAWDDVFAEL